MPMIASQDLAHMRDAVFYEGSDVGRRLSKFWILLILASIIATAGVIADSTATVIGAMIVAPLMTPIQGTMLAVVLGERANLARCVGLVIGGAAAAVAVGWGVGLLAVNDIVAETSSQVAGRINPRLIDLLAALATGVVGSVALVRRDISDTLPGVAIAISLVPPLVVVGVTLEAGALDQAAGALLLFVTNVAAILATGTVVMALYGVPRLIPPPRNEAERAVNRRNAVLAIVALLAIVAAPLTASTMTIARDTTREHEVSDASQEWAGGHGWELVDVSTGVEGITARFEGPLPLPETGSLRTALIERGVDPSDVRVDLLPRATIDLGDGG